VSKSDKLTLVISFEESISELVN